MTDETLYVVSVLTTKGYVSVGGSEITSIDLSFADGMIGALPVFNNYEAAEKYAEGGEIFEIERK